MRSRVECGHPHSSLGPALREAQDTLPNRRRVKPSRGGSVGPVSCHDHSHGAVKSHGLGAVPIRVQRSWTTRGEGQREKGDLTLHSRGGWYVVSLSLSSFSLMLEPGEHEAGHWEGEPKARWGRSRPESTRSAGTPEDRQTHLGLSLLPPKLVARDPHLLLLFTPAA